jgi:hypothetical protein
MAKNEKVYIPYNPVHKQVSFVNADGACSFAGANTKEIVANPGSDDGVVVMVSISTDDTANNNVVYFISTDGGTTKTPIGLKNIPLGSGFSSGVKTVNGLDATEFPQLRFDVNGNKYIKLKSGANLYAGVLTAVTAAKTLVICTTTELYS